MLRQKAGVFGSHLGVKNERKKQFLREKNKKEQKYQNIGVKTGVSLHVDMVGVTGSIPVAPPVYFGLCSRVSA